MNDCGPCCLPLIAKVYNGLTFTFTVMAWTRPPLAPKIVMGTVSYGADLEACRVKVRLPLEIEGWLNDAVTPDGNPEAENTTVPYLKFFTCSGMLTVPLEMV